LIIRAISFGGFVSSTIRTTPNRQKMTVAAGLPLRPGGLTTEIRNVALPLLQCVYFGVLDECRRRSHFERVPIDPSP
jgi:hypothetical protein